MMDSRFSKIVEDIKNEAVKLFEENLKALILFGSVARNTAHKNSDIDLLFVFEKLPTKRYERTKLIVKLEEKIDSQLSNMRKEGQATCISPVIKSIEEASYLCPLYLDLLEDAIILFDKDKNFEKTLSRLRIALDKTKGRRIWKGKRWYWELKPNVKFGELIDIE